MRISMSLFMSVALVISPQSQAQDHILTDIRDLAPEQIQVEGFRLDRAQEVKIQGVGFRGRKRSGILFTRAWILDAQTREVVWEIEQADTERRGRVLVEFDDTLDLAKGDYEVYYATFPYGHKQGWRRFLDRFFKEEFDEDNYEDDYHDFRDELRSFRMTVYGDGRRYREDEVQLLHDAFNKYALISITGVRDDEYQQQAFELARPVDAQIYAIGEARKDGTFDYGWIINTETREKVWKMTYRNSEHAGGARKNRLVNEVISLPAGHYVAFFVTDASHSYRSWNAAPPYDPMFWGLTVRVKDPSTLSYVKLVDYQGPAEQNVICSFTRLRDNELRSKGFTLKRAAPIRVYAIGEGKGRQMYDYGWIVDANTHKSVWEMSCRNTEHAGGGNKNRLFDRVIKLNKGNYVVYYVTDGSHYYGDWNTAPPYDKEGWGIKMMAADKSFKASDVVEYEPERDRAILARLVRIRDHERGREKFSLSKDSEVRIYAIGEGKNGTMYDYAWIEDSDTQKLVWEMTYGSTRHAGGAEKNRLFDDVLLLQRGEYVVFYESDDSHSYGDWNDSPPYDPVNWGVTIYLVGNQ